MGPVVTNPKTFFSEVVETAFEKRKLKTFPLAQSYLVDLLMHYISTDNLYNSENESGKKQHPTLAELYMTATSSETGVRLDLLKKLGDTSLYVSGFFGESLQRKIVDVDYYAEMGGLAYGHLSRHVREDTFRAVYGEFSRRFIDFMDILTLISQKMMVQSDQNILRLYDHYIRTGSRLAKDTLLEKGIPVVNDSDVKKSQGQ